MGTNIDMVRRLFAEIDAAKVSRGRSSDVTRKMEALTDLLQEIEQISFQRDNEICLLPETALKGINERAKAALGLLSAAPNPRQSQPAKEERIETGWASTCYIASIGGVEVAFIHLCDNGADFDEWQSKWEKKGATVRVGTKHFT